MSFLRKAMLAIALVIPVAVAPSIAGDHKVKGQTITEVAASNPDFSTLVAALKAADLADALKGAGPFTVFAPTNAAFAALPAGTVENLLKPENKAKLQSVLKFHVIPAKIESSALAGKTLTSPATLQGGTLAIDGTKGVVVGGANVTAADVKASNGVIHVIDKVLLPAN
ncbi:MAG: fasciclin domain-containing protein [Alphaproteobacteria bacterium]|nr:fasciclin domain-containing protein [Alphaproteobacteria bacterium]